MKVKVISGGQTGADLAGLWAAKLVGIPTGGFAPKNWLTTIGNFPSLGSKFGLVEHKESYRGRTISNLRSSDLTIVCSSKFEGGTRLTINQCKKFDVPLEIVPFDPELLIVDREKVKLVADALRRKSLFKEEVILNVAGNSTRSSQRAFEFTFKFCCALFYE